MSTATPPARTKPNYRVAQLDQIPTVQCPCGHTRRAFADEPNGVATVHLLDVSIDARVHYHKKLVEVYIVLDGEGYLELDGDRVPLKPMTAVYIKPGCRHRAVGKLKIINLVVPPFDEHDEWFD